MTRILFGNQEKEVRIFMVDIFEVKQFLRSYQTKDTFGNRLIPSRGSYNLEEVCNKISAPSENKAPTRLGTRRTVRNIKPLDWFPNRNVDKIAFTEGESNGWKFYYNPRDENVIAEWDQRIERASTNGQDIWAKFDQLINQINLPLGSIESLGIEKVFDPESNRGSNKLTVKYRPTDKDEDLIPSITQPNLNFGLGPGIRQIICRPKDNYIRVFHIDRLDNPESRRLLMILAREYEACELLSDDYFPFDLFMWLLKY